MMPLKWKPTLYSYRLKPDQREQLVSKTCLAEEEIVSVWIPNL